MNMAIFPSFYVYVYLIGHSLLGLFRTNTNKQWLTNIQVNTTRLGRPVGYLQAQPRSWTRGYWEQNQLMVRTGFETSTYGFQIRRSNHLAKLSPPFLQFNQNLGRSWKYVKRREVLDLRAESTHEKLLIVPPPPAPMAWICWHKKL